MLAAFGVRGALPARLPGGQGRSWLAGSTVLKPVDDDAEAVWIADVLDVLAEDAFRVARPVRSTRGAWVAGSWAASQRVDGRHDTSPGRWPEVLAAGRAFGRAVGHLARPSFLDDRTHAWAVADRVAWNEEPLRVLDDRARSVAREVATHADAVAAPSQVVHGDLAANVLFGVGRPPAVLDVTPYWRPAEWCAAVVAVDAVGWHAAGDEVLGAVAAGRDGRSLLARAALFRLVSADRLAAGSAGWAPHLHATVDATAPLLAFLSRD